MRDLFMSEYQIHTQFIYIRLIYLFILARDTDIPLEPKRVRFKMWLRRIARFFSRHVSFLPHLFRKSSTVAKVMII